MALCRIDEDVCDVRFDDVDAQVWTERMREWLASQLLQPLVAAINAAHKVLNYTPIHPESYRTIPPRNIRE